MLENVYILVTPFFIINALSYWLCFLDKNHKKIYLELLFENIAYIDLLLSGFIIGYWLLEYSWNRPWYFIVIGLIFLLISPLILSNYKKHLYSKFGQEASRNYISVQYLRLLFIPLFSYFLWIILVDLLHNFVKNFW